MKGAGARTALQICGFATAGLYVLVATVELILDDEVRIGRRLLFAAVLVGIAVLVLGGIRMLERRPWPGVALASLGAVIGGFALFRTGLAIALAIAIVALSAVCARRLSLARA